MGTRDVHTAVVTLSPLGPEDEGLVDIFGDPATADTHGRLDPMIVPAGRTISISTMAIGTDGVLAEYDGDVDPVDVQSLGKDNRLLKRLVYDLAGTMMNIAGARDPNTLGHELKVVHLARGIAHEMGLSAEEVEEISMAGMLYEIGKLGVPEEVLANPGKLTTDEFEQVKRHAALGSAILAGIDFQGPVAEIVHQHHERLDGSGYPRGLKGDEILLGARILAVADVVDAMMSPRPYREAPGWDEAVKELESNPQRYDSAVVAACMRVFDRSEA